VSKALIFFGLGLCLAATALADNFVLADGSSLTGDIVKFDDHDAMVHNTASDSYTNIAWPQFSQDSLKQLAENPKYRALALPFINPTPANVPAQPEIKIKPVERMALPEHPSIFGGMISSSLGLFILLVIWAANLYAAFEVAVCRGKPVGLVVGLSAVLPIAGPVIFLAQPVKTHTVEEQIAAEQAAGTPDAPPPPGAPEEIQIVAASWQGGATEEKKPQPQVFSRGKFTFNKRFVETKFSGFIGVPKGDALKFTMELKTLKDTLTVECIKQVGQSEVIVETPNGQTTVAMGDISEIKLNPKAV